MASIPSLVNELKITDVRFQVVSSYLSSSRENEVLHETSCRLLLDLLPGLETSIVFQENVGLYDFSMRFSIRYVCTLCLHVAGVSGAKSDIVGWQ